MKQLKLGTALTDGATRALLLGSGELGKELTISLQRFGVEVIAVDRYPNAPAQHVAHRSHVIDMTDSAAVKQLIAMERPDFIIPEIEAIATEALAEIEAEGWCTIVPNARAHSVDDEQGRYPNPRRRTVENPHLRLCLRRILFRIAGGRRRRYRLSLLYQADHVVIRQRSINGEKPRISLSKPGTLPNPAGGLIPARSSSKRKSILILKSPC